MSGTGRKGADWIHLARDRDQWQASEDTGTKSGFTKCGQFFLIAEEHTALRDGFKSIEFVNSVIINQLVTTHVLDVMVSRN